MQLITSNILKKAKWNLYVYGATYPLCSLTNSNSYIVFENHSEQSNAFELTKSSTEESFSSLRAQTIVLFNRIYISIGSRGSWRCLYMWPGISVLMVGHCDHHSRIRYTYALHRLFLPKCNVIFTYRWNIN